MWKVTIFSNLRTHLFVSQPLAAKNWNISTSSSFLLFSYRVIYLSVCVCVSMCMWLCMCAEVWRRIFSIKKRKWLFLNEQLCAEWRAFNNTWASSIDLITFYQALIKMNNFSSFFSSLHFVMLPSIPFLSLSFLISFLFPSFRFSFRRHCRRRHRRLFPFPFNIGYNRSKRFITHSSIKLNKL